MSSVTIWVLKTVTYTAVQVKQNILLYQLYTCNSEDRQESISVNIVEKHIYKFMEKKVSEFVI